MIHLKKNGVDWELAPDFEPSLDKVLATAGQVIKRTPTKLVTKHEIGGKTIYLKRYLNAIGLRPFKYYFRPSEARNEWGLADEVTRRGIPLVRHLACGERWAHFGLQESIIITEGFDGVPLSKYTDHQAPETQAALGTLLRQMHDHGALQPDLHHNILVRPEPLELRRIDVDRGELKPSLTQAERLDNLAYLNIFVPLSEAFFRHYGADNEFAQRVRQRSPSLWRPVAAKRARRCLETNLRFMSHKLGGIRWWVRLEFLGDKLRALLADPDAALAACPRPFKSGPHRQSTIGSFNGFVLKRFNQKNRWNYVKDLFRPSRAYRAYQKAYHLELLGIATPRPVAAAERRVLRVLLRSYLVTEEIRDTIDLRSAQQLDAAGARRAGEMIGRLHEHGFSHSDLKESNIVWDARGNVYVLDLDGLDYLRRVPEPRAAADLQRLARGASKYSIVTRMHRAAFLRAYCRTRRLRKVLRA